MTRMTEAAAAALDPAQAVALAQVLGLQAQWQNLRDDGRDYSTARLHGLQRTFEAFRVGLAQYAARYGTDPVPEAAPTTLIRLGAWCRAVGAVVQRAATGAEITSVGARAYGLADQLAGRLGADPVGRLPGLDTREGALAALVAVGQWCAGLAARSPADDTVQLPCGRSD